MSLQKDLNPAEQRVLKVLAAHKAMPFLELSSVCELPDEQIRVALESLSKKALVTIRNPKVVFDEIISVTGEGFKTMMLA
jgi:hypothetical protein